MTSVDFKAILEEQAVAELEKSWRGRATPDKPTLRRIVERGRWEPMRFGGARLVCTDGLAGAPFQSWQFTVPGICPSCGRTDDVSF